MKKGTICAAALALSGSAMADITTLAPGYDRTDFVVSSSEDWVYQVTDLGHYFSYKITGIQYKLTSGTPFGGAVWKGNLVQGLKGTEKKTSFPGYSYIWAWVNDQWILTDGYIYTTHIDTTSGVVTQYFDPPLEFSDENVTIGFAYLTNMKSDNDVVRVLGEAVSQPPVPTGAVEAPSAVREGASPTLDWDLTRVIATSVVTEIGDVADGTETTDTSDNSDTQETTTNDGSDSGGTTTDGSDTGGTTTDGGDSGGTTTDGGDGTTTDGSGKSNNGHGNNADGVDISNPGKSAQKWADKWGIIDTSAPDDDEAGGGGSAISLMNQTDTGTTDPGTTDPGTL